MLDKHTCEYCGAPLRTEDQVCPNCGAPNPFCQPQEKPEEAKQYSVYYPQTIRDLQIYCSERGMPLEKMRFFVGQDFQEPRAFGIYQDDGEFVVYKNKADGSRAVRYRGKDEAHAVSELYEKLMQECYNRGIYPDGKPVDLSRTENPSASHRSRAAGLMRSAVSLVVAASMVYGVYAYVHGLVSHQNDGYYRYDNEVYYRYGDDWYLDNGNGSWTTLDYEPITDYSDYYAGDQYDSSWGGTDFRESKQWEQIQESDSSDSSDYDSWDSNDTDWDSDW